MFDVANLDIKPGKCKIVFLAPASFNDIKNNKDWIAINIPEWIQFGAVDAAEYLGFSLSPGASARQWCSVEAKFHDRLNIGKNKQLC